MFLRQSGGRVTEDLAQTNELIAHHAVEAHELIQRVQRLGQQRRVHQIELADLDAAAHVPLLRSSHQASVRHDGVYPPVPVAGSDGGPHALDAGIAERDDAHAAVRRMDAVQPRQLIAEEVHFLPRRPDRYRLHLQLAQRPGDLVRRHPDGLRDGIDGRRALGAQEPRHHPLQWIVPGRPRVVGKVHVLRRPLLLLLEPPDHVHIAVQTVERFLQLVPGKVDRGGDLPQRRAVLAASDDVKHPSVERGHGPAAVQRYEVGGVLLPHVPDATVHEPAQQQPAGAAHVLPVGEPEAADAMEGVQRRSDRPHDLEHLVDRVERSVLLLPAVRFHRAVVIGAEVVGPQAQVVPLQHVLLMLRYEETALGDRAFLRQVVERLADLGLGQSERERHLLGGGGGEALQVAEQDLVQGVLAWTLLERSSLVQPLAAMVAAPADAARRLQPPERLVDGGGRQFQRRCQLGGGVRPLQQREGADLVVAQGAGPRHDGQVGVDILGRDEVGVVDVYRRDAALIQQFGAPSVDRFTVPHGVRVDRTALLLEHAQGAGPPQHGQDLVLGRCHADAAAEERNDLVLGELELRYVRSHHLAEHLAVQLAQQRPAVLHQHHVADAVEDGVVSEGGRCGRVLDRAHRHGAALDALQDVLGVLDVHDVLHDLAVRFVDDRNALHAAQRLEQVL